MRKLNNYWRLLATALSFGFFGLGGTLISLILCPLIVILPVPKRRKKQLGQNLVHYSFKLFIELMRILGVLSYHIEGAEKLNDGKGHFVIANHPSLIDVIFLVSIMKQVDCIVKQQLWRNPCMMGALFAANYISNNDDPEELIQKCAATLKAGNSLIIFPEGTRSVPGEAYNFQRGAANISILANKNLTPVILNCYPTTLTKADKWYQIPPKKFRFELLVQDEFEIQTIIADASTPNAAARRLTKALENYYQQEMPRS